MSAYTPSFYAPNNVGKLYLPNNEKAFNEGAALGIRSATSDPAGSRVLLIIVDGQVDFVFTEGALSVPGAIDDTRRLIEWMYKHTVSGQLTTVAASLDSHVPIQIFHKPWWINSKGEHPAPFTAISVKDLEDGTWFPRVSGNDNGVDLQEWSYNYVETLSKQAKKDLMIWPFHCLIGQPGQALVPALSEAISFHSGARGAQPNYLAKGNIARTEHYSIVEPEIKVPEHENGGLNTAFLDMVGSYDLIYVAGQAKSHCVLETIRSMMKYFGNRADVISKMRFLMDATSSVKHPVVDFEAISQPEYEAFARKGAKLVTTLDPIS